MPSIVQTGPNNQEPFPLIVTTTRKNKNPDEAPLIENFRVEEMAWTDPVGIALRNDQQDEFDIIGKEPGVKPSAEDVAIFIVSFPISSTTDKQNDQLPVACAALRNLGSGYFEIKRMYAVSAARGTGAALSILASLEHYVRAMGAHGLRLETGNMQLDAKRFYEKHGYTEIPLFGNYKDAKFSNCYEKLLPGV